MNKILDVKDKKILGELLLNSRASITSIAKRTGISREVAVYRITNLNKKIIKGYYTSIDLSALGYKRYGCVMQFSKITLEKEEELIANIARHKFVSFLGPVIGKWNVAFDIHARDEAHLQSILGELKSISGIHLDSFVITSPGANYEYFPLKYIEQKQTLLRKKHAAQATIDDVDKKILSMLAYNSRTDYVELSKQTKLSANAIKYRIKNMEKIGIIRGYTVSLDYNIFGFQFYNIQLKVNMHEDKKLISYLRDDPSVIYYYGYIGQENWDMDIGVIIRNSEELRKIIVNIKKEFGEMIKIHDIFMNSHIVKDDVAPEGVFK